MVEQGSDEWKALRCGKVTASRIADVMARTDEGIKYHVHARDGGKWAVFKEGATRATKVLDSEKSAHAYADKCMEPKYAASRANYMAELIAERLTGQPAESFTSAAMQWGIDTEPYAREAHELKSGDLVDLVDFVPHPEIEMSGASPDGLINDDGLIEIKCPNTATHIEYLLGGKIDRKYILQMQWQMACTRRAWVDFVSYDPRMSDDLKYKTERVERDEALIADITFAVRAFLSDLDAKLAQLEMLKEAA